MTMRFIDDMLSLFKGQLSYNDILNMRYNDAITLRDIRIEKMQKQQSQFQKATNNNGGFPGGMSLQSYEELAEELEG